MKNIDRFSVRKVAYIGSSAIGDTIMHSIPFCRGLKAVFPNAQVTLITGNLAGNKLIESCPYIDHKVLMEAGTMGKIKLLMKLLSTKYDIVFDPYPSASSATLVRHMRKKESVCYAGRGYDNSYTLPVQPQEYYKSTMHQDLELLHIFHKDYKPSYEMEIFAQLDDSLVSSVPHDDSRKIVIHLGGMERDMAAGRNPRCRTNDRWISLLNKVRKEYSVSLIFIGAKDNIGPVQEVIDGLENKDGIYNFAGKSSLAQTLSLVKHTDIMLCTDSGPMHFGLVYDKPVVGLWGKIAPHFDFFVSNPIRKDDVMDISVEDAYTELVKVL